MYHAYSSYFLKRIHAYAFSMFDSVSSHQNFMKILLSDLQSTAENVIISLWENTEKECLLNFEQRCLVQLYIGEDIMLIYSTIMTPSVYSLNRQVSSPNIPQAGP